jgi:ribosomal protein L37E
VDISNCTRCGQLIFHSRSSFCKPCLEEQKPDIEKVRDYLMTHSNATLLEVHNETGIPLQTLQALIKDGVISTV